jgi:hypothetical protein
MRQIMLKWIAHPSVENVTMSSIDFSFQILVFWNLFEFLTTKIISKIIFLTFWIQILPNKFHYILFIEILPITPKAHSNSFEIFSYDLINFSMKKSFNKQKLLHCKSKRRGTNPVHPSPRAFQRHQKHGMKHPDLMDSKTKQTTFLHK